MIEKGEYIRRALEEVDDNRRPIDDQTRRRRGAMQCILEKCAGQIGTLGGREQYCKAQQVSLRFKAAASRETNHFFDVASRTRIEVKGDEPDKPRIGKR